MNKRNLLTLLGAFLCWGSLYVVSKVALGYFPPVTTLALRYVVSVPALFLLLKLRRALTPIQKEDVVTFFIIGFTGYFASFCIQMLGIDRLTGSVSSLLGAMNPIFIPILAAFYLGERLTPAKIGCVILSMIGVVTIVGVGGTVDPIGALLMLLSVFLWSTTSVIIRRIAGKYDPMQIALIAILFALPFVGCVSVVELQTLPYTIAPTGIAAVIFMGLVGTAGAHTLWNTSLKYMDASFCSMFYPLQPLVAATLGVIFLGEQITVSYVLGALIICCGIVCAVIFAKPKKQA